MPPRHKPGKREARRGKPLAFPLVVIAVAAAVGVTAFVSGSRATGLPILVLIPVIGLLLFAAPLLIGMLLLRAGNREISWRTAGAGSALAAAALGIIICTIVLFGAGFRGYVAKRATAQEVQAAAADLLAQHPREERLVLSPADVRSGPSTVDLVHRLRPKDITIDQGGRGIKPTVFIGWGGGLYTWGIEATPTGLKYRYGYHETGSDTTVW